MIHFLLQVIPLGQYLYPSQDDLVVKAEIEDVPYFNAPIYLENKEQIGKIDEIFGNIRDFFVSVKLSDDIKVKSFKPHQKVCTFQSMSLFFFSDSIQEQDFFHHSGNIMAYKQHTIY